MDVNFDMRLQIPITSGIRPGQILCLKMYVHIV